MIFPVPFKVGIALDLFWAFMFLVTKERQFLELFIVNAALSVAAYYFSDRY